MRIIPLDLMEIGNASFVMLRMTSSLLIMSAGPAQSHFAETVPLLLNAYSVMKIKATTHQMEIVSCATPPTTNSSTMADAKSALSPTVKSVQA